MVGSLVQDREDAQNFREVMVELDQPPPHELKHYDRSQKFHILRDHAEKSRSQIIKWIEENELTQDIVQVAQPTVFNLLFVMSTHRGIKELEKAPGVTGVFAANGSQTERI